MKEFTADQVRSGSITGSGSVMHYRERQDYAVYVGLDVHKETIVVAPARCGRGPAALWRKVANTPKAVAKLLGCLGWEFGGEVLAF